MLTAEEVLIQKKALEKFFKDTVETCLDSSPDEDRCHLLLDGLLKMAKQITDVILAAYFEEEWKNVKKKINKYADPHTFTRYETDIAMTMKKILAPARMEL